MSYDCSEMFKGVEGDIIGQFYLTDSGSLTTTATPPPRRSLRGIENQFIAIRA